MAVGEEAGVERLAVGEGAVGFCDDEGVAGFLSEDEAGAGGEKVGTEGRATDGGAD